MSTTKFAKTHNLVAFLEKPKESNGFEGIIDFLNASSIKYALTVNPTVYESCIKQSWETAKAKTVNGERQIQALVDKNKVIITEKSVRSDLMLEDAEGTECLPNDGRKIADLDADAKVTLIDETQERYDEEMLFDVQVDLQGEEVVAEKEVVEKEVSAADPVTTAGEVVTTANATTTVNELALAQTLIKIKAAKPKAVTTDATTITTAVASTRPKVKGIVFHDQEEQASAFTPIKKDQIALDEELASDYMLKNKQSWKECKKKELHKKKLAEQQLLKNWIAFKL
ncbi:hypothetical protein Tco_0893979 [Tanacetum coccineum]|uniref:Xylulose kinase-1 n=1 Tax=Tanacetum coccineum TaxID=301880 RepID=A0ABQ5CD10_9ASTR